MSDLLRGEYDEAKVERFRRPIREAWRRVRRSATPPPGSKDRPDRAPFDMYRVVLMGIVIALAAGTLSLVVVPAAAVLGHAVKGVNKRLGTGPSGQIVLPQIAQRSVVLAKDGSVIATLTGDENRKFVALAEVPPTTQQAVLAIEDARFYEHHGIDTSGILRAIFANATSGGVREGGSTITQQLVKNTIVGTQRSIDRKIKEAQYAIALEHTLPKRRILELYLNEAYFGNGVYGIGTAAEFYFGKPVKQLTLAQSALLAGLISSPERYDPLKHLDLARNRRNLVLGRMSDLGYVSKANTDRARTLDVNARKHALAKPVEPYFVEFIKQQLFNDSRLGETQQERIRAVFEGGLRIETTLDIKLETAAKDAVAKVLNLKNDPSAALASIEPSTGAVRALVGGRDFKVSQFDLAVLGRRQPGSTFKPFALVAALDAGVPTTLTLDTPSPIKIKDAVTGQEYEVNNYDKKGEGYITLRKATENSVNSYYVQLTQRIGADKVVAAAKKLGITSEVKPIMSIALGTQEVSPYEMASAYSTLANQGTHCKPYAIERVVGADGKALLANQPDCERVLDGSVAALATDVLAGVIEHGTGRPAKLDRPAAGKTGTTEEYSDAWFGGYTPQFATVVWMGFQNGNAHKLRNIHGLPKVFGGSLPAAIWTRYMKAAHEGLPIVKFPKPPPEIKTDVPSVVGKTKEEATKLLSDAGFTVKDEIVKANLSAGTVIGQTPAAGANVPAGVLVTIQVSDGTGGAPPQPPPRPAPSPSPRPAPSEEPTPTPSPTPTSKKP
ncbi:MAG: penicillin-binding protein [Actinomycetota bacterium]